MKKLEENNKDKQAPRVENPQKELCLVCGTPLFEHLCKLICPNCGNRIDCTD